MDKVYNIIKSLIGIILIFSFVMAFSSCEKKQTNENKEKFVPEEKKDTTKKTRRFSEESREIEIKLDSLKARAERKGVKAQKEINEAIDKLSAERKEILSDSTSDKVKATWDNFKVKAKKVIDSLDKKI